MTVTSDKKLADLELTTRLALRLKQHEDAGVVDGLDSIVKLWMIAESRGQTQKTAHYHQMYLRWMDEYEKHLTRNA